MRPLERPKVFEKGGPRAENVLEDGLRPAQSLDLMRTGLRPLVVSLPTYNRLCALRTGYTLRPILKPFSSFSRVAWIHARGRFLASTWSQYSIVLRPSAEHRDGWAGP